MENTINWFPGHMQKTTRIIKEIIKEIDLIIQIVDARATNISANDELIKEISNQKNVLKIALKKDLSSYSGNILSGSIFNRKFKNEVISKIKQEVQEKIKAKKKKGFVNPKIYVIVVGLPNVGKSSFINFLANKQQLITGNTPGVTKKKNWLNVNSWIEMLDTPGVLYKKISNFDSLAILALTRTIKWDITPKKEIIEWGYNYYLTHHQKELQTFYNLESNNFNEFLDKFCNVRKLFMKKGELNYENAIEILYKDFSDSHICQVNYEKTEN